MSGTSDVNNFNLGAVGLANGGVTPLHSGSDFSSIVAIQALRQQVAMSAKRDVVGYHHPEERGNIQAAVNSSKSGTGKRAMMGDVFVKRMDTQLLYIEDWLNRTGVALMQSLAPLFFEWLVRKCVTFISRSFKICMLFTTHAVCRSGQAAHDLSAFYF